MRYLSVCSGIEAASVAWEPLGWTPAALSEIEPFPRAVLAHRFPTVPLHGDFTTIRGDEYGAIDVLVGGTPCQDFSVAGLRAGIAGERGNLTLEFLRLAARARPDWLVWENVPGLLSSDGGRALGAFLGGLAELGYGFAYRVLDAQYFHLAQRRERVFVVGCLGDWRRAAAVLFERESLRRDTPPSREAREGIARPLASSSPRGSGYRNDADTADNLIAGAVSSKWAKGTGGPAGDECYNLVAPPLTHNPYGDHESREGLLVAHALRADGFDASEDGTGRGTPLVAFSAKDHGADAGEIAPTLRAGGHAKSHANAGVMPAVAFQTRGSNLDVGDVAGTFGSNADRASGSAPMVATHRVRRLTPRECERLQGFPDDWTLVPYRGKPAADGPRYKALGNSMAVPVMRWIGRRIALVTALASTYRPAA